MNILYDTPPHLQFLLRIDEAGADNGPRLVYSDWLEENGETDLAFAYRWSVSRGLRPHRRSISRVNIKKPYCWWAYGIYRITRDEEKEYEASKHYATLPFLVSMAMGPNVAQMFLFYSDLEAMLALSAALVKLKETLK